MATKPYKDKNLEKTKLILNLDVPRSIPDDEEHA